MSRRGDPRLPTADQIERHGLKDWAHRLVLRLYDRFRDIDSDMYDTALGPLSEVTPAADTVPYFTSATAADTTAFTAAGRTFVGQASLSDMRTLIDAQPASTSGTWTPTITFDTPGDLSVTYSNRNGTYVAVGNMVHLFYRITTSAFTHSTASGNLRVTGIPFDSDAASNYENGVRFNGITKASYTDFYAAIAPSSSPSYIVFPASGSGVGTNVVTAADMPTGGQIVLIGQLIYMK